MATITIHGSLASPFTRATCMAAHEKSIDYDLVLAIPGQMGSLNPFEKVPVMTHGDFQLFESMAILRYFDRVFPGPKLWPEDARGAALCDQWSGAVSDSLVNVALRYIAVKMGFLPVPAEMHTRYLDGTKKFLPVFDARLGASPFLAGDRLSAADLFLYPLLEYFPLIAELAPILEAAPNCRRWMSAMEARPSAKATVPAQRPPMAA